MRDESEGWEGRELRVRGIRDRGSSWGVNWVLVMMHDAPLASLGNRYCEFETFETILSNKGLGFCGCKRLN